MSGLKSPDKNDLFNYVTTFDQKAFDGMYIVYVRCKLEMYSSKLDRLETNNYYSDIMIIF